MLLRNETYRPLLHWLQLVLFAGAIMYFGKSLLVPLSLSLLIALILYPSCMWLEKQRWPRSLAIAVLLFLVIILFSALAWLLMWQLNYLSDDIPAMIEKLKVSLQEKQQWLSESIGISISSETGWLLNKSSGNNIQSIIQAVIKNMGGFLFSLFLIPLFSALFLYHREQFMQTLKALIAKTS